MHNVWFPVCLFTAASTATMINVIFLYNWLCRVITATPITATGSSASNQPPTHPTVSNPFLYTLSVLLCSLHCISPSLVCSALLNTRPATLFFDHIFFPFFSLLLFSTTITTSSFYYYNFDQIVSTSYSCCCCSIALSVLQHFLYH